MSGENSRVADARHRLLNDMGIEAWYLRRNGTPGADAQPAAGADAAGPDPVPARAAASRTDTASPGAASARAAAAGDDSSRVQQAENPTRATAAPPADSRETGNLDTEPFTVVALGVAGALLIAGGFARAGDASLARDVVRALGRDWSAKTKKVQFTWPQAGASGAPGPALAAFIEKQAEDHAAGTLLVTESVAARLGADMQNFASVPEIETLTDPRNKAALWRRLQTLDQ